MKPFPHRTGKFYKGLYIPMDVLKSVMQLQFETAVVKTTQDAIHHKRAAQAYN